MPLDTPEFRLHQLPSQLDAIRQTTDAILDRLDYKADDEGRHKDVIEAICTLTHAVIRLAEVHLYR